MAFRKRAKKIDVSPLRPSVEPRVLDVSCANVPARVHDLESDWKALGDDAWRILEIRRMKELFPDQPERCEFQRYLELLRTSSPRFRQEVFIGLEPKTKRPLFVPRKIFTQHSYILGATGSGKTSHALSQLLIQLAESYEDEEGKHHPRPPLLIIDLKQTGDPYLRALATQLAQDRRQPLRFFSNDPEYKSMAFDPFHCLRSITYPLKRVETILNALSMIYAEGYGSDFFTEEQRIVLRDVILNHRPKTFDSMVELIKDATRDGKGNKDARGLYSALSTLTYAKHLHTDGSPIADEDRIDLDRFLNHSEILYLHLDGRGLQLLSREIAKLILFSLLETASSRQKRGNRVQCFVLIDEFHRLAAQNLVQMLEDARSAGIGFILSHQSSESLKTRDNDLYPILFQNCSFKQTLTLEDDRVIELFRLISGRIVERRYGGGTSRTNGTQIGQGWTYQFSRGSSLSRRCEPGFFSALLKQISIGSTQGQTGGRSGSESSSESTGESTTWKDELSTAFTDEMVTQVNDTPLLSIVHVKGAGNTCLTPSGSIPGKVLGLYPFSKKVAEKMEKELWPMYGHIDEDEYYRKVRPRLQLPPSSPNRPRNRPSEQGESSQDSIPLNQGAERELVGRLRALARALETNMIEESCTAAQFARQRRLPVDRLIQLSQVAGWGNIRDGESRLTPAQIKKLKELLADVPESGSS